MRAGIGQAHHHCRIGQHLVDGGQVLVEERVVQQYLAVGFERQVDERLDGCHPATIGDGHDRVVRVVVVARRTGADHVEAGERVARRTLRRFGDERRVRRVVTERGELLVER